MCGNSRAVTDTIVAGTINGSTSDFDEDRQSNRRYYAPDGINSGKYEKNSDDDGNTSAEKRYREKCQRTESERKRRGEGGREGGERKREKSLRESKRLV